MSSQCGRRDERSLHAERVLPQRSLFFSTGGMRLEARPAALGRRRGAGKGDRSGPGRASSWRRPARGGVRVQLVRGEGRGVSD